jgi:hypothetical protein
MAVIKEIPVEEKLKSLYQLQQIDTKINEIKTIRGELPMEVRDMEDELEGLKTRIEHLQSKLTTRNKQLVISELLRKKRNC